MKALNCSWPIFFTFLTVSTATGPAIPLCQGQSDPCFFLDGVAKLFYYADKGADILGERGLHTWCMIMMTCVLSPPQCWRPSRNYSMALATSGPAIIQRSRALGLSVRPTAPPSPLINALFCSCTWSIGIEENTFFVFSTVNLPAPNSLDTPGCFIGSAAMSLRSTGIHLA